MQVYQITLSLRIIAPCKSETHMAVDEALK